MSEDGKSKKTPKATQKKATQKEEAHHEELELTPREELEALLNKAEEALREKDEQLLREKAEAQNMQRRFDTRLSERDQYIVKNVSTELLPVVDSLGNALLVEMVDQAGELYQGIKNTYDLLLKTLAKFGVQQIDPEGEMFNPDFHEAISTETSDEKPNTILRVLQKGYLLKDRLIRPALVIVAK